MCIRPVGNYFIVDPATNDKLGERPFKFRSAVKIWSVTSQVVTNYTHREVRCEIY